MKGLDALAREMQNLERKAKGEDSLLALDVLKFVGKWRPIVEEAMGGDARDELTQGG